MHSIGFLFSIKHQPFIKKMVYTLLRLVEFDAKIMERNSNQHQWKLLVNRNANVWWDNFCGIFTRVLAFDFTEIHHLIWYLTYNSFFSSFFLVSSLWKYLSFVTWNHFKIRNASEYLLLSSIKERIVSGCCLLSLLN